MYPFEEFAELVERRLSSSWRSVVVMRDEELLKSIDSTVFTMSGKGPKWKFSFALRVDGTWKQAKREIDPFDYDTVNLPKIDDIEANKSPENRASDLSMSLLSDVAAQIRPEGSR